MKRIVPVVVVTLLFIFTSCKNHYTCDCELSLNGVVYETDSIAIHDTKKNAENECRYYSDNSPRPSGSVFTCTLSITP